MRTKYRVSEFRFCHVLPSKLIDFWAGFPIKAIRFLPGFLSYNRWWEYEREVEIDFVDPEGDERDKIAETCGACGACCRDIPTHQIGIYMSPKERLVAENAGFVIKSQGKIKSDGINFDVLAVTHEGDCAMLGPSGCTLGDFKPLWCKIYHCEKYQGRPYQFEEAK